jgi:RHS repeat-associated protein
MTRVPKPDNWSSNYNLVYDAWNRLVKVYDSNGTTLIAQYQYDGLNRRVKKIVGSETRLFYYNSNWQCLEEYVGTSCNARYFWGLRYIDDLILYRNGSTDYYTVADPNWNVVALTNNSGVVQERYTYSSFGKLNVFDASFTPKSTSSLGLTRTFTGQTYDIETGLMLYRNRVYHPTLGRFIQRDPIGYGAGDVNLMRYVGNKISVFTDFLGLQNPAGIKDFSENYTKLLKAQKAECSRKLSDEEKKFINFVLGCTMSGVSDDLINKTLDRITYWNYGQLGYSMNPIVNSALNGGAGAITMGNNIYYNIGQYPSIGNNLTLQCHECVHSCQVQQSGLITSLWLLSYLDANASGWANSTSGSGYDNNSYEIEAYAIEEAVRQAMLKNPNLYNNIVNDKLKDCDKENICTMLFINMLDYKSKNSPPPPKSWLWFWGQK